MPSNKGDLMPISDDKNQNDFAIPERVSSLEANVNALTNDVRAVSDAIRDLAASTNRSFQLLTDKLAISQRTQWPVIFGALGMFLAVAGAFGAGYIRDQARNEHNIELIREHVMLDQYVAGATEERIKGLEKAIARLIEPKQ